MKKNKQLLIVFAKPPIPGLAKTRLIPALGVVKSAELHQKLVLHTLDNVMRKSQWDTQLWCSEDIDHAFFKECTKQHDIQRCLQKGKNLGDRMNHAMKESLLAYEAVSLIGTDCPVINDSIIDASFTQLKNADMVFNPAEDGGYVLLSAKNIKAGIFEDVVWGGHQVMEKTISNAEELQCRLSLLPTLWDVDVPEDLNKLLLIEAFRP